METIWGMIVGGVFRLAPELIKFADRFLDRQHELKMQDKQLEFHKIEKYRPESVGLDLASLSALQSSVGQQYKAENKWSPYVRPMVTYTLTFLYAVPLVFGWREYSLTFDLNLLSGVLSFWFLDRVMKR
jgi:hypothetical protein